MVQARTVPRRTASTLLLGMLLSVALVVAGPAGDAMAYVPLPPPVIAAPISTVGAPAIIAGVAAGALICVAIDDCRNFVGDFLDGRDSGGTGSFKSADPGEALPGNTLSWNTTPGGTATVKPTADPSNPEWVVNWNPTGSGSPGGYLHADVTCGPPGGVLSTATGWLPITNIYPGNPAGTFHVNDVCAVGDAVWEVRAYINSAEYCDECGGDIVWRAAGVDAVQHVVQTEVTCRAPNGATVTITGSATSYTPGEAVNLEPPSCSGPDGNGVDFPATPVIVVEDNFNRANGNIGNTSNRGLPWQDNGNRCRVVANGTWGGITGSGETRCIVDAGQADGTLRATIKQKSNGGGMLFRCNSTCTNGWLWLGSGAVYIRNGGSYQSTTSTAGWAVGDQPEVVLSGNTITFKVNGTVVNTRTNATHAGNTWVGVRSDTGDHYVDDLVIPRTLEPQTAPGVLVEVRYKCGLTVGTLEECVKQGLDLGVITGTEYEDCLAGPNACILRLYFQGQPCQIGTAGCVNWQTKVDASPADYQCRWGTHVMPINDCDGLATRYNTQPQPTTTTTTQPQPTLTAQPQPTTSPSPTATDAPRPGEAGAPDATDSEGNECWPSGWGVFNPLEWVYRPVVCALKWSFVPSAGTWEATMGDGGALGDWKASPFGQWNSATGDVIGAFAGIDDQAGGCDGPVLDGQVGGVDYSLAPLRACDPPMSTVAAVTRGLLIVIVGFGGAFLIIDPIFAAIGLGVKPQWEQGELF